MNKKILTTVIIIAVMAGALFWMIHDRQRPDLKVAVEATVENRSETDKQVETVQLQQKNYVERVKSKDEQAHKRAVMIDEVVSRDSRTIHSDDIGFAIDLELELYERSLGTGIAGLDDD